MTSTFLNWLSSESGQTWLETFTSLCATPQAGLPHPALWAAMHQGLLEANEQVNLTKLCSEEEFAWRHVMEAAGFLPFLPPNEPGSPRQKLLDLGSGGGFPALPLALLRDGLEVVSVDSVQKKVAAQQAIIQAVQQALPPLPLPLETPSEGASGKAKRLNNIKVVAGRFEDLARHPNYRGKFDWVTARAVAALPTLLEYAAGFLKPGGCLLALKGPSWEAEWEQAQTAALLLKLSLVEVQQYPLERLNHCHWLVFECDAATPKAYPRKAGIPQREPLAAKKQVGTPT